MVAGHELLEALAEPVAVPDIGAQELLQGARRDRIELGDRLGALARQIAELPADVVRQMLPRLRAAERVRELLDLGGQRRTQGADLFVGHP
jgi:hypothetical protein